MARVTLDTLTESLQACWSAETSTTPLWSADNPAIGHDAVSAMVLDDYLGAPVVRGKAILPSGLVVRHYFNSYQAPDAGRKAIDSTLDQFPRHTTVVPDRLPPQDPEDYRFTDADEALFHRYALLAGRVAAHLLERNTRDI
jgi:hypothetical protein